ncbi:MAG TPA: family 10 glycosylhydrolase [Candidatus Pacearchaeota archaeon]|nr:family 10 glycosylhydrolase [Candidatus Pacearchaeota archaeon]
MKKKLGWLLVMLLMVTSFFSGEVGVLVSEASKEFYGAASYQDLLNGTYMSLDNQNIDYEIIDTLQISMSGIPENIKVLIIPSNAAVSEREAEEIEKFIQRGGKLLGGYEATLRFSDGQMRPNYVVGPYLGIQYSRWETGKYNYMILTDKGKEIFGEEIPAIIKMPRGFTFVFKITDPEVVRLAEWAQDPNGNPSTNYEENCAIALGKCGIFFSENVFALALGDEIFQTFIVNSVRYLLDLPPTVIEVGEIELKKLEDGIEQIKNEIEQIQPNITQEKFTALKIELTNLEMKLQELKSRTITTEEVNNLKKNFQILQNKLLESDLIETRAIWLDYAAIAEAKTPENLSKIISELANLNFNLLLPEVIYQGRTISKKLSEATGYPLSELFIDWEEDPLEIIITEAHKKGMEVHPWVWVFAIAHTYPSPMLDLCPEWIEKDKFGNIYSESQTVWFSHANEDARNFIKNSILTLVEMFGIDGIHLDYIRYASDYMGYDEVTISKFQKETGIDPFTIEKYSKEAVDWQLWRENLVTSFVQEIYSEVKKSKPEIVVSTAVGPSLSESRLNYKQNWGNWAQNHYVDALFPMDYKSNLEDLSIVLDEQKKYSRYVFIYPGLAAFSLKDGNELIKQVGLVKEKAFPGVTIFSVSHLKDMNPTVIKSIDISLLKIGYFREKALPAHSSLKGIVDAFKKQFNENVHILSENGFLTERETSWLIEQIDNLVVSEEDSSLTRVWDQISSLKTEIAQNIDNYEASIKLVNEIYKIMDILRPTLYAQERESKPPIIPEKPPEMVVVENPLPIPTVNVRKTFSPPAIDGIIDDIWKEAEWTDNFVTNDTGESFPYETKVKLLHDNEFLYVLFWCEEPDISNIKIVKGQRDTRIYLGDSVEVFIWPNEYDASKYYHYVVSVDGTIYDEVGLDSRWNGRIEAATNKLENAWIAEIKIDLKEINVDFSLGTRINFNRNKWKGDSAIYGCWSCTYGSFHNLERFGYAKFE